MSGGARWDGSFMQDRRNNVVDRRRAASASRQLSAMAATIGMVCCCAGAEKRIERSYGLIDLVGSTIGRRFCHNPEMWVEHDREWRCHHAEMLCNSGTVHSAWR